MCVISYQWPGQNCQRSQFQGFDAFGWIIQVEKDFPCLKILGLSCSDALTGGVFCKTGKVFDFWDSLRSINFGISVLLLIASIGKKEKGGKIRPVSKLLLKLLEEYETVSGTRDLIFLPSDPGATNVARNTLPRPSLVKRVASDTSNPRNILGAFGVKGTQLTELAKGGSNREKVGNLDQEHGQVRLLIDMAVQGEVEIALDELVDKVECNVLSLPQPPVPLEVRSMRGPAKRTFSFCLRL